MDERQKHYQDTNDYILCDYIYTKCPEKTTLQRQKTNQWLPEAECGTGDYSAKAYKGTLRYGRNALKLDYDDDCCTTL